MTQLTAQLRDEKTNAGALRRESKIPAIVYHKGKPGMAIAVDAVAFEKTYEAAGESTIVDLSIDGKVKKVLIHEIQHDPVRERPIHIDFFEVDMKEKVQAAVELEFINEAPAVKMHGGILIKKMDEVEAEALPGDLVQKIEVDLSPLTELDSAIHIKDLTVPAGLELQHDPEGVVVSMAAPRMQEEEESATSEDEAEAVAKATAKEEKGDADGEGEEK